MKSFVPAGIVCALLALVLLPPAFAIVGMALGVAVLARGRMEHGLLVIVLAGACGYLGMSWGMTADASLTGILWKNFSLASDELKAPPPLAEAHTPTDWKIVSLKTRVTKIDDARSLCSWKLVVKNDSPHPAVFHGSIQFEDAKGLELLRNNVNPDGNTQIAAASEGTFTGSQEISSAIKPARAVPMISKDN